MNILKIGKTISFYDDSSFSVLDKLEKGNYVLNEGLRGIFLEEHDNFTFPKKIYGKEELFVNHVLNYYQNSDKNVAVALVGRKGQGKSLTAKLLSERSNLPVILIKEEVDARSIIDICSIDQPLVIFVDEFEKLYEKTYDRNDNPVEKQNVWLSILDGTASFKHKHIFIFTSNKDLSEYLVDRPSRIRYMRNYDRVSTEIIQDYVNDNLVDKSKKDDLISVISSKNINLDILSELIKEINFSNLSVSDIISFFNYNPDKSLQYSVDIETETGEMFTCFMNGSYDLEAEILSGNIYYSLNSPSYTNIKIIYESVCEDKNVISGECVLYFHNKGEKNPSVEERTVKAKFSIKTLITRAF